MSIDKKQLEINFNLHSMQPGFLNLELHYIISKGENDFRFARWDVEPETGESKFYCFLTNDQLHISAGNITLNESYKLTPDPLYPLLSGYTDFVPLISLVATNHGFGKGIRRFYDHQIDDIQNKVCEKFGDCEKHIVKSSEASHILFIIKDVEISISETMVYFRHKAPFSERHYQEVKEQECSNITQHL